MPPKVFVALPCYGEMPARFAQCLLRLAAEQPCSLVIKFVIGDSLVSRARNTCTAEFLASDCTHLLFVDSDLVFTPAHLARLLSHDLEVVGGFYPKKQDGPLEWVCNTLPESPAARADGLQPLRYIGTGFLLVAREVFTRLAASGAVEDYETDDEGKLEWDYWCVGVHRDAGGHGRYLSEDWFFCQRCLDLGIPVFGDTQVILQHLGHVAFPLQSQQPALATSR